MAAVERVIRRARRRVALDLAVRGAGWGLFLGAGVGLGALALDRIAGWPVPVAAYPVLAAVGAALAVAVTLRRLPGAVGTAIRLDRALRLDDRLGTAESIGSGRRGDLAALVRAQAERLAGAVDVRSATPVRVTPIWTFAVVHGAALGLGVWLMPEVLWASPAETPPDSAGLVERQARIAETISEAVAEVPPRTLDAASQQELDALERLAEQLGDGGRTDAELAEARDQSAARMETIADRLAEQAQRNLDAVDEVTRRFSGLESPQPESPTPADDFAEALRRGELDAAAERFDELMEGRDGMTDKQLGAAADELQQLGDELTKAPQQPGDPGRQQRVTQMREALEDLGLDEDRARQLLDNPRALEEALREQGLDEETLHDLSEDLQALDEEKQVRDEADQRQQRLADALREAAQRMREQQREQRPPEPRPQQPPGERQPGTETQQQTQEQRQQRGQTPGESQQQQRPVAEERPGQAPQETPQEVPQPGAQERPQETPRQAPQPGAQEMPQQAPQETPQQGTQPGTQGQGTQHEQPPGESVSETLRELERMRRGAGQDREASERLRQAARELADTLSDEEKRELAERWLPRGEESGQSTGRGEGRLDLRPPADTARFETFDDVDLRDDTDDDAGRIIAEWLSDEAEAPGSGTAARGRALRRAQAEAEQALEKSIVPSRYHSFIRRYFGRLEETFERAADNGAADTGP